MRGLLVCGQVIYHLRHDSVTEAYELIKDLDPSIPQEYILKGVVNTMMGQNLGSREHLKMAQQFFQLVTARGRCWCCPREGGVGGWLIMGLASVSDCRACIRRAELASCFWSFAGWSVGERVRHDSGSSVHGVLLFPAEAV